MNYYAAREIIESGIGTGLFHYTVDNRRTGTAAVGYCAADCPGHPTPDDACEHYRQYLLDKRLCFLGPEDRTQKLDVQYRCQAPGCDNWADGIASLDMQTFHLCTQHRNRETVEKLVPSIGQIWSSY